MSRNETKDKTELERLVFMGLMKDECTVNDEVMPVFAGIFAWLFYWDVHNHFIDDKQAVQTMTVFQALLPVKGFMASFAASINEIVSVGSNNKSEKLEEKM